jgi:hypothetical protein
MLSLIFAASLVIVGQPGPAEVHAASLGDLVQKVPLEKQYDTRYVSLHSAAPGPARDSLYAALVFSLNSTSFRSTLAKPPRVYGGTSVRLSLSSLGWDTTARTARIERLKGQGVDVSTFKPDLWEEVVRGEPYFFATYIGPGKVERGWIDPAADYQLRLKTHSSKAIVRADWLISRLLREAQDGGVYSQALLLPPQEADLYKAFGVDQKLVDSDPILRSGGAVLDSIVALHNRELQLLPSLYGYDERFIWRTFDFATDATGDKSVIETLGGKVKHDGREIIFTLPNGLHGYYLSNGAGAQVNVVPQNIAIDQRSGAFEKLKDRSVTNSFKCVSCHGPAGGIQAFDDVVGKAILAPGIGLAAISYSKDRVAVLSSEIEDYYLAGIPQKIARQNASYTERVKTTNGLTPGENALAVNETVEDYVFGLVTPEDAAREMGQSIEAARVMWRASGNPYAVLLSAGISVRRAAWESAFVDVQRANVWPWEHKR